MLRTIEEVLGLENLGVHDAGLPPMTDAFDTTQATWTFNAVPAPVLFNTSLPLLDKGMKVNLSAIPKPTHDAAWWEARTKGFDFSKEDRVPTDLFNHVIWSGLMSDKPYPTVRSGADLRQNRQQLLNQVRGGNLMMVEAVYRPVILPLRVRQARQAHVRQDQPDLGIGQPVATTAAMEAQAKTSVGRIP